MSRGDVNEAHLLLPLAQQHQHNTGYTAHTVVADSKYGTIENYLACHDQGVAAHIPDLKRAALKRTGNRGIFLDTQFVYDAATDTYTCPAGQRLSASPCMSAVPASTTLRPGRCATPARCDLSAHATKPGAR